MTATKEPVSLRRGFSRWLVLMIAALSIAILTLPGHAVWGGGWHRGGWNGGGWNSRRAWTGPSPAQSRYRSQKYAQKRQGMSQANKTWSGIQSRSRAAVRQPSSRYQRGGLNARSPYENLDTRSPYEKL